MDAILGQFLPSRVDRKKVYDIILPRYRYRKNALLILANPDVRVMCKALSKGLYKGTQNVRCVPKSNKA